MDMEIDEEKSLFNLEDAEEEQEDEIQPIDEDDDQVGSKE